MRPFGNGFFLQENATHNLGFLSWVEEPNGSSGDWTVLDLDRAWGDKSASMDKGVHRMVQSAKKPLAQLIATAA